LVTSNETSYAIPLLLVDFFSSWDYLGKMLLFPLWAILASVPCVYAAARYTRSRLATFFVSFSFLISVTVVLLSFSRFTGNVSVAYVNDLFLLEVSRVAVLGSLFVMICTLSFLVYYLPTKTESSLPEVAALIHLLIFCALGSFFAADLLSFSILFEAVPLLALALVVLEGRVEPFPYRYLLYFAPSLLLLVFMGLIGESICAIRAATFQVGATSLLAVVLAARLLFFPFGQPALKCLPLDGRLAGSYAIFSLPAVALFALLKFVPYSGFLGQAVSITAALSMTVWAILCFRKGKPGSTMLYAYLAQTATVATMVAYPLLNGRSESGVCLLIVGNHLVSSLGMLMCASVDEGKRGRFGNAALIFFVFCMLGLPPSPGFFGRLILFKTSFAATDLPGYLLRLSFLVNLFLVYCQSGQLAPIIGRLKSPSKTPVPLAVALLLLGGCLFFGMLFTGQVNQYLAGSKF
jgi:formate hydrogenlyase subunit 3/multisubunit Na+/H+ antiporter MnhD subunit